MNNAYMGKQRSKSTPMTKGGNGKKQTFGKGDTGVTASKGKAAKAKKVGRRISQHKRMAMGEKI